MSTLAIARRLWCRRFLEMILCFVGVVVRVHGQAPCDAQWLPGPGLPGTNGDVYATTSWDPDGPGPEPTLLIAGGLFSLAERVEAKNIAAYNPVTGEWRALGSGLNGVVYALATLPNGDLVAGGSFAFAGDGTPLNLIARWNGSSWVAMGGGILGASSRSVNALAVLPNGSLVAAGDFRYTSGQLQVNAIATWDGQSWSTFGTGMGGVSSPIVNALAVLPGGELVAGGTFTTAGGVAASRIALWNGGGWLPLGSGMAGISSPVVNALKVLSNGHLIATGDFTTAGGVSARRIALWDGATWSGLGAGLGSAGFSLQSLPNGTFIVGGQFSAAGGSSALGVALWDGAAWSPLGAGVNGVVRSLTRLPDGRIVAGGFLFAGAGSVAARSIAVWDQSTWAVLGNGVDGPVRAIVVLPDDVRFIGGDFTAAGGTAANRVARWSNNVWSPLGPGVNGTVNAIAPLPNGRVVCGGDFTAAGALSVNRIALWDGSAWASLGSGANGSVAALCVLPNGDLVAGGNFSSISGVAVGRVARWNGTAWFPLGSGVGGRVRALLALPSGELIAGGDFSTAGGVPAGRVASWNGNAWSPLGSGVSGGASPSVYALARLANGDIVAGGDFNNAGGTPAAAIARWNGTSWAALGAGVSGPAPITWVYAMTTLPSGDLIVGGSFATAAPPAGLSASRIARWDGSNWSALGTGMGGDSLGSTFSVLALATDALGSLDAGGEFLFADGIISASFARYSFGGESPTISFQPVPVVACRSTDATLSVGASGSSPLRYQWRADGVDIDARSHPSAATPTLLVRDSFPGAATLYDCVISNACGQVTTDAASITLCLADVSCDGFVDIFDYDAFVACFEGGGESGSCPAGVSPDFNNDGFSDAFDYDDFVTAFERGC